MRSIFAMNVWNNYSDNLRDNMIVCFYCIMSLTKWTTNIKKLFYY